MARMSEEQTLDIINKGVRHNKMLSDAKKMRANGKSDAQIEKALKKKYPKGKTGKATSKGK